MKRKEIYYYVFVLCWGDTLIDWWFMRTITSRIERTLKEGAALGALERETWTFRRFHTVLNPIYIFAAYGILMDRGLWTVMYFRYWVLQVQMVLNNPLKWSARVQRTLVLCVSIVKICVGSHEHRCFLCISIGGHRAAMVAAPVWVVLIFGLIGKSPKVSEHLLGAGHHR